MVLVGLRSVGAHAKGTYTLEGMVLRAMCAAGRLDVGLVQREVKPGD
jgi:hypothetical protein